MTGPLEGIRVVEVAGGVPAAFCGHLLGGYGADVVRARDLPTWYGPVTYSMKREGGETVVSVSGPCAPP